MSVSEWGCGGGGEGVGEREDQDVTNKGDPGTPRSLSVGPGGGKRGASRYDAQVSSPTPSVSDLEGLGRRVPERRSVLPRLKRGWVVSETGRQRFLRPLAWPTRRDPDEADCLSSQLVGTNDVSEIEGVGRGGVVGPLPSDLQGRTAHSSLLSSGHETCGGVGSTCSPGA